MAGGCLGATRGAIEFSDVRRRAELAGLLAAMIVAAVNIPLGATLLGLWAASRAVGDAQITMGAIFVFVIVAGAAGLALTMLLGRLGARYDELRGRTQRVRRHVPWLRAMSGERVGYAGDAQRVGALDVVLVLVVAATVIAFEIWFAFFSGSPFDARSGRD